MSTKLSGDQVNDPFPIRAVLRPKSESNERVARRAAIAEDLRALLAANRDSLMPLNGTEVFWY